MDINVNKHSSIRINNVYVDPFKIDKCEVRAECVFITHPHYDHLSVEDIDKIVDYDTIFVGPSDVINELRKKYKNKFIVVEPNEQYRVRDISFETFPSYNMNKKFHPRSNQWVGYVINIDNIRYAILGDTDLTDEVKNIRCDVLFVPIGGIYTMNAKEASEASNIINPKLVVPVHYNDIVGNKSDEEEFLKGIKDIEFRLFL